MHGFRVKSKVHTIKQKTFYPRFSRFLHKRRFNRKYLFSLHQAFWFWAFLYIAYKFGSIINIYAIAFTDFEYLNHGINKLDLPIAKTAERAESHRHRMYITINKNDVIEVNSKKIPLDSLHLHLQKLLENDPYLIASIYADKNCTMGPIHKLFDEFRKAKVWRIIYHTEKFYSATHIQ